MRSAKAFAMLRCDESGFGFWKGEQFGNAYLRLFGLFGVFGLFALNREKMDSLAFSKIIQIPSRSSRHRGAGMQRLNSSEFEHFYFLEYSLHPIT